MLSENLEKKQNFDCEKAFGTYHFSMCRCYIIKKMSYVDLTKYINRLCTYYTRRFLSFSKKVRFQKEKSDFPKSFQRKETFRLHS